VKKKQQKGEEERKRRKRLFWLLFAFFATPKINHEETKEVKREGKTFAPFVSSRFAYLYYNKYA
jgi:hypothetical protein